MSDLKELIREVLASACDAESQTCLTDDQYRSLHAAHEALASTPAVPDSSATGSAEPATISAHIDSLEDQLNYSIGRVKEMPTNEMVALVTSNFRSRLANMRAALSAFDDRTFDASFAAAYATSYVFDGSDLEAMGRRQHAKAWAKWAAIKYGTTPPAASGSAEPVSQREIANAIWLLRREEEDRCDLELDDVDDEHSVWAEAAAVAALYAGAPPSQVVPSFSRIAQFKLDDLIARGHVITGYSIELPGEIPTRGFVTCGGFVGWWHSDHPASVSAKDAALTDAQIEAGGPPGITKHSFAAGVRFAERAHGIGAQADGGKAP